MTKKSAARLAKDAQRKAAEKEAVAGSTCWDELNSIYGQCVELLTQQAYIYTLMNNEELVALVPDIDTLNSNVTTMAEDVKRQGDLLVLIHCKHQNKTGGGFDPDEVMESIAIGEEYSDWMAWTCGTVVPLAKQILAQFNSAEIALFKKRELEAKHAAAVEAATGTAVTESTTQE